MEVAKRYRLLDHHKLNHSPEDIFPLICPFRNSLWMPGWTEQCRIVYAESGRAEKGCVFQVTGQSHLTGSTTLVCTTYDPPVRVHYTGLNDDLVYQIKWRFKEVVKDGWRGTEVELERIWTALNERAEAFIAELSDSAAGVPDLFRLLEHYLDNGRLLGT